MSKESATRFFNRYHHYPPQREGRMVTPVFDVDYTPVPKYEDETADIKILLPEIKEAWLVHSDVITDKSNFFRMALATPLLESRTKEIKLYGIDGAIMEFIVKYMYSDWSSAATLAFGLEGGAAVPPRYIAEILIVADFLDIPQLCYAAYHMLLSGMAGLVMRSKTHAICSHILYCASDTFLRAASVLEESKTKVGLDLGGAIYRLMERLGKAWNLDQAVEAFVDTFPEDRFIIDLELQW
ncbi:hypothetical protein F4815DRAFT_497828 [Daldinia loculata]|nr:hypothetical protein F4815DRAFT_497828 [Daldinia loculata]